MSDKLQIAQQASVRERRTGTLAKTSYVNELARALQAGGPLPHHGTSERELVSDWVFIGVIVAAPDGKDEFTDNRYWVAPQYIKEGAVKDRIETKLDVHFLDVDALPATDIGDQHQADDGKSSTEGGHKIGRGTPVIVHVATDAAGAMRFFFVGGPPLGTSFVVTLVATGAGSNGTQTTAATYTYDLYAINDPGTKLNKSGALGPEWPRPAGTMTTAVAGLAYYATNGDIVLIVAFEQPGSGHCPT